MKNIIFLAHSVDDAAEYRNSIIEMYLCLYNLEEFQWFFSCSHNTAAADFRI